MNQDQQTNSADLSAEEASFGGFAQRQAFAGRGAEPSDSRWSQPIRVALILFLFLLAAIGVVSLFRGDFFQSHEDGQEANVGTIKIPQQGESASGGYVSADSIIAEAEKALVTLEMMTTDGGVVHGSGFVISDDGYAVCHDSLLRGASIHSLSAYTAEGILCTAEIVRQIPSIGVVLLKLQDDLEYFTPITPGNAAFIKRGQTLYGIGPVEKQVYYGIVSVGVAVSVQETVSVSFLRESRSIPILYTSIPADPTLCGGAALDESGAVIGFLTDTLPGKGGGLAVIPINTLISMINEILSN